MEAYNEEAHGRGRGRAGKNVHDKGLLFHRGSNRVNSTIALKGGCQWVVALLAGGTRPSRPPDPHPREGWQVEDGSERPHY